MRFSWIVITRVFFFLQLSVTLPENFTTVSELSVSLLQLRNRIKTVWVEWKNYTDEEKNNQNIEERRDSVITVD